MKKKTKIRKMMKKYVKEDKGKEVMKKYDEKK